MKKLQYLWVLCFFTLAQSHAQTSTVKNDKACINCPTDSPDPSAVLEIQSNDKGILIPRVASTASISTPPATGLMIYDNSSNSFKYYDGTDWQNFGGSVEHISFSDDANSFIGVNAGNANIGNQNTAFGSAALYSSTDRFGLVAVGDSALYNNGIGVSPGSDKANNNTAIGSKALYSNTRGLRNTANGSNTLFSNTTGDYNTVSGFYALYTNISGSYNTANGYSALNDNTGGDNNTAIGLNAGRDNTTGINNTFIGWNAGRGINSNDKLYIGAMGASYDPIIFGDLSTGNVGLGTTSPQAKLDVNGTSYLRGNVGLGTTLPQARLDVNGTSYLRGKTGVGIENDDSVASLMVRDRMVVRRDGASLDTDYNIDVSFDRRFRIWRDDETVNSFVLSGSNLGIGKDPSNDISIKQANSTDYTNAGFQIEAGDDSNDWSIYINQNDNDLSFRYNNVLRAYIQDGSGSFAITSDRRLKEAIEPIEDILDKVLLLKPSTYYYKSDEEKTNKSIGFISQEVEEIFPEMIAEHEGIKGLVYDNFAVLGIKAIQEQHNLIEDLQKENKDLKDRLSKIEALLFGKGEKTNNSSNGNSAILTGAKLLDNQPNPFSESTTFRYFIPESVQQAELRITNANGETLKVVTIGNRGEGQTILEAHALSAGNYFYSLVLDGKVLETKQMILVQ